MKIARVWGLAGLMAGCTAIWCSGATDAPTASAGVPDQVRQPAADPALDPGLPLLDQAIDSLKLTADQKQSTDPIVKEYRRAEELARRQLLQKMKMVLDPRQMKNLEQAMDHSLPADQASIPDSNNRPSKVSQVAVAISAGHETDRRDGGRPVVLVAGAVGVSSDVFRKAFSGVTPATGGRQPEAGQVRRNKEALLRVLAPYGITNDRLDEVSNYYRYVPGRGELWPVTPAAAFANIKDGLVTGFTITNPGSGYSSPPQVSVPSFPGLKVRVELNYGDDFKSNGSVRAISVESK